MLEQDIAEILLRKLVDDVQAVVHRPVRLNTGLTWCRRDRSSGLHDDLRTLSVGLDVGYFRQQIFYFGNAAQLHIEFLLMIRQLLKIGRHFLEVAYLFE